MQKIGIKLIFRMIRLFFIYIIFDLILGQNMTQLCFESFIRIKYKWNVSLCFSYSTDENKYGSVATVKLTFADNTLRLLIVSCMQSFGFEMLENILDLSWIWEWLHNLLHHRETAAKPRCCLRKSTSDFRSDLPFLLKCLLYYCRWTIFFNLSLRTHLFEVGHRQQIFHSRQELPCKAL